MFFKPPKLATPSSVATVACRRAAVRLTPPAGILSGARLFAPRDLIKADWTGFHKNSYSPKVCVWMFHHGSFGFLKNIHMNKFISQPVVNFRRDSRKFSERRPPWPGWYVHDTLPLPTMRKLDHLFQASVMIPRDGDCSPVPRLLKSDPTCLAFPVSCLPAIDERMVQKL